jgi:hypothetical protein
MTVYYTTTVDENINKSIRDAVEYLCKENNINYKKQEYKVLFSNEKLLLKNNNVVFTSGSNNYLSFYGKAYLDKNKNIVETVYLENSTATVNPTENSLLVIRGGVGNSTTVEEDKDVLYFYVVPNYLLKLHDQSSWQTL